MQTTIFHLLSDAAATGLYRELKENGPRVTIEGRVVMDELFFTRELPAGDCDHDEVVMHVSDDRTSVVFVAGPGTGDKFEIYTHRLARELSAREIDMKWEEGVLGHLSSNPSGVELSEAHDRLNEALKASNEYADWHTFCNWADGEFGA